MSAYTAMLTRILKQTVWPTQQNAASPGWSLETSLSILTGAPDGAAEADRQVHSDGRRRSITQSVRILLV